MRPIPSLARALLVVCFAALVVLTVAVIALSGPFASADPRPARLPAVEPVYVPPSPDYEEAFSAAAQHDAEVAAQLAAAEAQRQADEAAARAARAARPAAAAGVRSGGSHRGYATAKECVSMVEHGGSYDRSTNPTHFGKYQFARSTWASFGGDPATWGNATPAEQDAVFETAWNSPGGPNHWLPYDGCG